MKKNKFIDYIISNRYVILCVGIVLVLLFTGILKYIFEAIVVVILLALAVYIGKRIQEDQTYIRQNISKRKDKVEYTVKDDERETKSDE